MAVFGLGGVGSYAAEALARAGVGSMMLVDFDRLSISNINRQLLALEDTLGMLKTEVMAARISKINPQALVEQKPLKYTGGEEGILLDGLDYILDAVDDVEAKVSLIKNCFALDIPVISSMGAGNKLDPAAFKVTDISKTSVCPLARAVRRRLKQEGIASGVKVVFSTEQPAQLQRPLTEAEEDKWQKKPPGSISFVPPVAGYIMASVVVRDLLQM